MKKLLLYSIIISFVFLQVSKTYAQDLSFALESYENMQYDLALKDFGKVWKKQKEDLEVNLMYGKCILKANIDRTTALPYLKTVFNKDKNYKDVCLALGITYMYKHQFDTAKKYLQQYLSQKHTEKDSANIKSAQLELQHCKIAKELIKKKQQVSFINLGKMINTKRSEFNPFLTPDDNTLFYTSNKVYDSDLIELIKNGYFSTYNPLYHRWSKMKSLGKAVNTSDNEKVTGISKDGKKIIITVDWMGEEGDLFITSKDGKKFQELNLLSETVNSKYNEQSGSLSAEEDTLYFSSNRPGGKGGSDIYTSVKLPNGEWGKPLNMGAPINTPYNEEFPNISKDGATLYFASNNPKAMGGYDVFKCTKNNNGTWSEPINLGYPINNCYDNTIISFSKHPRYAYTSQIRPEGMGGLDIYKVVFEKIPAPQIIYTGKILAGDKSNSQTIEGDFKISVINQDNNKEMTQYSFNKNTNKYTIIFIPGKYKISISGQHIETFEKRIVIPEMAPAKPIIKKDFYLKKK